MALIPLVQDYAYELRDMLADCLVAEAEFWLDKTGLFHMPCYPEERKLVMRVYGMYLTAENQHLTFTDIPDEWKVRAWFALLIAEELESLI